MELKEVILSTLAEMEEGEPATSATEPAAAAAVPKRDTVAEESTPPKYGSRMSEMNAAEMLEDECRYLESVKERLLVLFEGFQSPNNTQIEAKVDLTLNFLEYLLATIDSRIENIKRVDDK